MSETPELNPSEVVLPVSGIKVAFRGVKGYDFVEAERACKDRTSTREYGFSMLARRCLFNGRQAVIDDVLTLDEEDINTLMETVTVPLAKGSQPNP